MPLITQTPITNRCRGVVPRTTWKATTVDRIEQISKEIVDSLVMWAPINLSEGLRQAATFAIESCEATSGEFVQAGTLLGYKANTLRNRYSEGRRFFEEMEAL